MIQSPETSSDIPILINRACAGDEDAFAVIVNLYRNRVIRYCVRMIGTNAEDVAQEVFIKFYLALDRFDSSRPLAPFLFRIAHNHCIDILKKKDIKTTPIVSDPPDEKELQIKDDGPGPEELIRKAELQNAVKNAMEAIPALYRSPLVLWHVEGVSYEEISEMLELPIGTIKAQIHRGRKMLQQKLMEFVVTNGV